VSLTSTAHPATAGAREPGTAREPRLIHACILLVTSGLTVLVTAILGPSMPAMQAHFAGVPGADYLVPLTMTAPMLMMAFLSIFAGELADRFGRKRLLVGSTALYAVIGTAPLYLDSLVAIIASRFALGVMEAALMTISTTMIGDYWSGARRERFMSLQTTVAATSAFLLNGLGGAIAEHGWRAPYAAFAASLLLAPLMAIWLWEPASRATMSADEAASDGHAFRPGLLALICALAVLLGIVFMILPVHFGYLYGAIGVQSPARIGMAYAVNSLGVISGTFVFGWLLGPRWRVAWQLAAGAAIAAAGFVLMRSAGDYDALTAAGFVNGVGCGILLPTMVSWNMRELPLSKRGFGIGAYQSCFFLGIFFNPLIVVGLEKQLAAPRAAAVGQIGMALLALAALAAVVATLRRRRQ
jgi:MFS family permease